jgi:hypothetical protein
MTAGWPAASVVADDGWVCGVPMTGGASTRDAEIAAVTLKWAQLRYGLGRSRWVAGWVGQGWLLRPGAAGGSRHPRARSSAIHNNACCVGIAHV